MDVIRNPRNTVKERSTGQDPKTTTDDNVDRYKYLVLCGSVSTAGAFADPSGLGLTTEQIGESADGDGYTPVVVGTGSVSPLEATVSKSILPLQLNSAFSAIGTIGPAVEGTVSDDSRRYQFAGDITDSRPTNAVSVYVDGVRVPGHSF